MSFENTVASLTEQQIQFLRATASSDVAERTRAITEFFTALTLPIRQGVMDGDNTAGIANVSTLAPGVTPEFPVDPIRPGTEHEWRAFTNPGRGRIPQHTVTGDSIVLPTIPNANACDWYLRYARNARWDVISRIIEAMMGGVVKKRNDDLWHTILASVASRGLVVYDKAANEGQFTRVLFSLIRSAMVRNAGGNLSSIKQGKATDIYMSVEGFEDILNWDLGQVPDVVRASMYSMAGGDNTVADVLGVRMHQMTEFGVGQEYQTYYTNVLGGDLVPSGADHAHDDVELAVALDLKNRDSFVMAYTQPLEIYEDPYLHREQKGGMYCMEEYGIGALDSRRNLAVSY